MLVGWIEHVLLWKLCICLAHVWSWSCRHSLFTKVLLLIWIWSWDLQVLWMTSAALKQTAECSNWCLFTVWL